MFVIRTGNILLMREWECECTSWAEQLCRSDPSGAAIIVCSGFFNLTGAGGEQKLHKSALAAVHLHLHHLLHLLCWDTSNSSSSMQSWGLVWLSLWLWIINSNELCFYSLRWLSGWQQLLKSLMEEFGVGGVVPLVYLLVSNINKTSSSSQSLSPQMFSLWCGWWW